MGNPPRRLKSLHLQIIGLIVACVSPAAHALDILVIGDSITLGQLKYLPELLPEHNVTPPPENGRFVAYKLDRLEAFLYHRNWDIIYLNSGLHDMVLDTDTRVYASGLRDLIDALRPRCRALVWGRTTGTNCVPPHPRTDARVELFNTRADQIIAQYGLTSVDLYAATPYESLKDDGVHFYQSGYVTLAETTADTLRRTAAHIEEPPRVPVAGPLGLLALAAALLVLVFRLLT